MWVLASQGLDYRTTKKISRPKIGGSLKDFLLASEKQFDIKPDAKPKAPKNHDSDVLVYKGPFEVEHADLLVFLLEACPGEMMRKLEERVRILTKEQVDFVIQALRSCPKEVVDKLVEQFTVIKSEELDRLNSMIKKPENILGEMDLQGGDPVKKPKKKRVRGKKAKPIIPVDIELKAHQDDDNIGNDAEIEDDHLGGGADHLKEREMRNHKEKPCLVETEKEKHQFKMEKDDLTKVEAKPIDDDNGVNGDDEEDGTDNRQNIEMDLKEIEEKDLKENKNLVDTEKKETRDLKEKPILVEMRKKGKRRKKMELDSSDDDREESIHKFPFINPRCRNTSQIPNTIINTVINANSITF